VFLGCGRMSEHGEGSSSAAFRTSFAVGRGLPTRISLNPPPPGRLTSLRSRDLTLGGYKKVPPSNVNGSVLIVLLFFATVLLLLFLNAKYVTSIQLVQFNIKRMHISRNFTLDSLRISPHRKPLYQMFTLFAKLKMSKYFQLYL